jgi:hypothetical protein
MGCKQPQRIAKYEGLQDRKCEVNALKFAEKYTWSWILCGNVEDENMPNFPEKRMPFFSSFFKNPFCRCEREVIFVYRILVVRCFPGPTQYAY